jgi:predicted AAA+ superfamily ATPase
MKNIIPNSPKRVIPRTHYIKRVEPFIGKNIIKVFTGQRRVGKSYLLFQLINHILAQNANACIVYIIEKEGEKRYMQVALTINDTKTIEREFCNLTQIKDNYNKTVITLDQYTGNTYQGIEVVNMRTFCL